MQARQKLNWLGKRVQHPKLKLQHIAQRVDELEQRLIHTYQIYRHLAADRLNNAKTHLYQQNPLHRLEKLSLRQQSLSQRMQNAMQNKLTNNRHRFNTLSRALEAVNPLATLGRGYAIVRKIDDQSIVRNARQLKIGDQTSIQLQHGKLISTVTNTED